MTLILAEPKGRRMLDDLVAAGGLLAFDFDGTLAPIVLDPASASLRPSTRELLTLLAAAHPCAVISGRARQDVLDRLRGIALVEVIGNHGAEPLPPGMDELIVRRRVAFWHAVLAKELLEIPGVEIENKRLSLAIHFRRARDRVAVENRIRCALQRTAEGRLIEGACVVNLVPAEMPDKGSALRRLCAKVGVKAALFVGDDEDVFRADIAGLLGVRVGQGASLARYFLGDQAAIDDLLQALLRSASSRGTVAELGI